MSAQVCRRCAVALVVAVCLALPASLAAQRFVFKDYGKDQGLANLALTCLLQDSFPFVGGDVNRHAKSVPDGTPPEAWSAVDPESIP